MFYYDALEAGEKISKGAENLALKALQTLIKITK